MTQRSLETHTALRARRLFAAFALVAAVFLFSAAGLVAQSPMPPGEPTGLPELQELATFTLANGNSIFFGAGEIEGDLVYFEIGRAGTDVAFPLDGRETLLDRFLTLAPADAGAPRRLVANDPDGMVKIGRREIVESAGPFLLDLPITDEGVPAWGCGANDTAQNFENQFCTWNFAGLDLQIFCDSQKWWDLIRHQNRKRLRSVTAYCGDLNSFGVGSVTFHNEWQNGGSGWDWYLQNLAGLTSNDWVYMDWFSASPKWKQARHTVMQSLVDGQWKYLGTLRGLTVFNN